MLLVYVYQNGKSLHCCSNVRPDPPRCSSNSWSKWSLWAAVKCSRQSPTFPVWKKIVIQVRLSDELHNSVPSHLTHKNYLNPWILPFLTNWVLVSSMNVDMACVFSLNIFRMFSMEHCSEISEIFWASRWCPRNCPTWRMTALSSCTTKMPIISGRENYLEKGQAVFLWKTKEQSRTQAYKKGTYFTWKNWRAVTCKGRIVACLPAQIHAQKHLCDIWKCVCVEKGKGVGNRGRAAMGGVQSGRVGGSNWGKGKARRL